MKSWELAVVTVLYGIVAVRLWRMGDGPFALVFTGYVLANMGLIWRLW